VLEEVVGLERPVVELLDDVDEVDDVVIVDAHTVEAESSNEESNRQKKSICMLYEDEVAIY
jgi:hypothetical protein